MKFILNISWIFSIICGYSVTSMLKFQGACLCYLRWYVSFQNSTDFLRSPSKWKTACNGFRDFLSRCMSKTKCRGQLFETHNRKRSMKFQSSFDHGIFIRTLWRHLLRKARKLVSLSSLDGLLTKIMSNLNQTHNLIAKTYSWNFLHAVKSHTNNIKKIHDSFQE